MTQTEVLLNAREVAALLGVDIGRERGGAIVCSTSPSARRTMAYALPDLPYAFDALEPHIDARTMEVHHDKHHAAYVNNVNAALEGTDLADLPIEELLQSLDRGQTRGLCDIHHEERA
jgi:hypothetical protein